MFAALPSVALVVVTITSVREAVTERNVALFVIGVAAIIVLVVMHFTGEVHRNKGRQVVRVEGTIDKTGLADFRVTKRLKGAEAGDIVDNARHHGRFKDDEFTGKFIVPGNDARGGEIKLKLQKPEDDKSPASAK